LVVEVRAHYSASGAGCQPGRDAPVRQRIGRGSYGCVAAGGATMALSEQQGVDMSDDKSKSGGQDRQRINVNEDYELRDWARSMQTTPERIKEAVQAVGDRAEKVRDYLGQDKPGR
jgi:hypothetical protein